MRTINPIENNKYWIGYGKQTRTEISLKSTQVPTKVFSTKQQKIKNKKNVI